MRGSKFGQFVGLPKEIIVAMLGVAMLVTFAVELTAFPRAADAAPTIKFSPAGTSLVTTPTVPVTTVPIPTTTVAPVIVPPTTAAPPPPPPAPKNASSWCSTS